MTEQCSAYKQIIKNETYTIKLPSTSSKARTGKGHVKGPQITIYDYSNAENVMKFVNYGDFYGGSNLFQDVADFSWFLVADPHNSKWVVQKKELEIYWRTAANEIVLQRRGAVPFIVVQLDQNQDRMFILAHENRKIRNQLSKISSNKSSAGNHVLKIQKQQNLSYNKSIISISDDDNENSSMQVENKDLSNKNSQINRRCQPQCSSVKQIIEINENRLQKIKEQEKKLEQNEQEQIGLSKVENNKRLGKDKKMKKKNRKEELRRALNLKPVLMQDRIKWLQGEQQKPKTANKKKEKKKEMKNKKIKKQSQNKCNKVRKHGSRNSNESQSQSFQQQKSQQAELNQESQLNLANLKTNCRQKDSDLKVISHKKLANNTHEVIYKNGSRYVGEMDHQHFHGKGIYYGEDFTFDGNWVKGFSSGPGIYIGSAGNVEKGTYLPNFVREGQGQDQYCNGDYFVGMFKNQKRNGPGTYKYENGDYYQGNWVDNTMHGRGKEYLADGSYYEGTWQSDEKHGQFTFVKGQQRIKQMYQHGRLVWTDMVKN